MPPYLCFDTETTGLASYTHGLLEVGALALDGKLRKREGVPSFHTYVRPLPSHRIDARAIAINKCTWVRDPRSTTYQRALTYEQARKAFQDYVRETFGITADTPVTEKIIAVGWNVDFDLAFLKALYEQTNTPLKEWPFHYHKLDLLSICRYLDLRAGRPLRKSYSLEAMSKELYGGVLGKFAAHTALGDAHMCLKILESLENLEPHAPAGDS